MAIKDQLESALKDAMKAGDDVRKRTIRMVLAAIRQVEIDQRVKLDDTSVITIIQKEIKTRKDAVAEARRANRSDVVTDTEAEIVVLEYYLPRQMSPEELTALVQDAILEVGAASSTDMGKVMKLVMPRIAGRAAGAQVNAVVRQILEK